MIVPFRGTGMNGMNGKSQSASLFVGALLVIGAAVGALTLTARLSSAQSGAPSSAQPSTPSSPAKNHAARFSHSLPQMDGSHLRAIVVEVNYGPGESDKPHSHPCAVIGHVAQGAIRFQVKG
jgi:hypothetical protein